MHDYHAHLWPHPERAWRPTVDELAHFCGKAAARGVHEVALTEHLFRFRQARELVGTFWDAEPDAHLRAVMARYWDHHATADLDEYVEVVVAARDEGLPLLLGMEVDHYPGLMGAVGDLLAGYPFDLILGSVHWIGAWLFDFIEDPESMAQWGRRGVDAVWDAYTAAVEELAATGTCDVLAHPDLVKVTGRLPAAPTEFHHRLAEAVGGAGMAAEVSSAGWRKPVGEQYPSPGLLALFRAAGVPVTTASDSHGPDDVGHRLDDVRALLTTAGYDEVCAFRHRRRTAVPLAEVAG